MTVSEATRPDLLDATDDQIEDAVEYADPMVLRGLLYQLTGNEEIVETQLKTMLAGFTETTTVASDADIALLRRKAADFLKAYRDGGAGEISIGPEERLPLSISLTVGDEVEGDHLSLCLEEIALNPWARGLEWQQTPPPERVAQFSVTIIGAALGGLNAALQLKRAGIPYTIVEKNAGVGGTWFENRYPGARVDTPSRGYTNIFGVDFPYPNPFCPWIENQRYFDWVADTFELRDEIIFNTEVHSLTWDEESSMWEIEMEGPDGQKTLRSNAVITAVGFLNRPSMPEIEGMAEFEGPSWHTARWPEGTDLRGKRIAVIGTGATGYQTIPELALEAGHVTVFQRTPQWLVEVPGYRSPFPPQVNWLDRNLPYHTNFMRLRASSRGAGFATVTDIDPDFDDPYAVSEGNKRMRDASISFLERKVSDPDLVAKMTPSHPAFSARPILVDPEYSVLDAILRDNVTLVTEDIRRITETGIESQDGTQHDVDVIVYATGFHATEYLYPMKITGRGGRTVEELWKDGGARAYTFSMIPGFPNLWSLYGPNTNGGLGPGAFHECVARYAIECMERLILDDTREIEAKEEAYWRFNELVDERNACKVWSDPRAHNYYWTEHGRSAVMCPFSASEIWRFLRHPNFEDLEIH